ncbi:MAG TPA: MgtC/SapB family protein [Vicinamibacterales bacterium]|nr:MgtC/SapB family protein [Vicinamibacterales bacterium]
MEELFSVPNTDYLVRVAARLGAAALLGGLIGFERERVGKAAGLRTHMTVALGCATFMLVALESSSDAGNVSRAIQGIAAGIGFIGAGTILKRDDDTDIKGLTTAAGIWMTAAVGAAAGAGHGWLGLFGVLIAFLILSILSGVDTWLAKKRGRRPKAEG